MTLFLCPLTVKVKLAHSVSVYVDLDREENGRFIVFRRVLDHITSYLDGLCQAHVAGA